MRGPGTEELCTEVAEPYFGRISKLILQSTFYIVREKKKAKGASQLLSRDESFFPAYYRVCGGAW